MSLSLSGCVQLFTDDVANGLQRERLTAVDQVLAQDTRFSILPYCRKASIGSSSAALRAG